MIALTERKKVLIVNNVIKAIDRIEGLNNHGYGFLYLASGFIAHYNINGFKDYYQKYDLKKDILDNVRMNMWNNFTEKDSNYDYYMSKRDVYERIIAKL